MQAVAYARIRHAANAEGVNDDYGRTDRQRLVMEQLFNKAVKLGKSEYVGLAKALIPCSETSLSYSEIISLAFNILLKSPTFEQTRIPMFEYQMSSKSVKGVGSCVYYDLNYASKLIKAFIYDDIKPEDYIAANGVEKNDWYSKSGGTSGSTGSKNQPSQSSQVSSVTSSKPTDNTSSNNSSSSKPESGVSSDNSSDSSSSKPESEPSSSSSVPSEDKPAESSDTSSATGGEDGEPMD
ncbi:MAG TPA: hypothetical protein DDY61_04620 [Ruminococcaceae bacterium]|nr:hypothetical protein [Oscillospiraceae bacterium]